LGRAPAYALRDVWRHETTETAGVVSAYVPAHGTVVYRVAAPKTWADYAPATDLSVTVPPAYPGATISVVQPGTANPRSTAFTNHGRMPATQVATSLSAPAGPSRPRRRPPATGSAPRRCSIHSGRSCRRPAPRPGATR